MNSSLVSFLNFVLVGCNIAIFICLLTKLFEKFHLYKSKLLFLLFHRLLMLLLQHSQYQLSKYGKEYCHLSAIQFWLFHFHSLPLTETLIPLAPVLMLIAWIFSLLFYMKPFYKLLCYILCYKITIGFWFLNFFNV